MNLYVLVEGKQTERKVYPQWLTYLLPELQRQDSVDEVVNNDYYLFSGEGFPSILTHIETAIEEVNEANNFDYLLVVIDADEETVTNRRTEITDYLQEQQASLKQATLIIIVQNRTMETWFLGNQKIFKNNPQNPKLVEYIKHYNVQDNDPELMPILANDRRTHAQFHHDYCKAMLKERNIDYSKRIPRGVVQSDYLEALIQRNQTTGHLASFQQLIEFCQRVQQQMT